MKYLVRTFAILALATVAEILAAPPASAHTITGVTPTNYRSQIDVIAPAVPGIEVRLLDLGRRVQLVNRTTQPVIVLGYQSEPYLRVGSDGVYENRHAPTGYLNRSTSNNTTATPPATADAAATPAWRRIGSGPRAQWRDRRTRWEGPTPAAVRATPHRAQVVSTYALQLRQGPRLIVINGHISWQPPPSAAPWLLVALGLFIIPPALGTTRHPGLLLSATLAGLIATDVVHSFAAAAPAGDPVPTLLSRVLLGGALSTIAWIAGLALLAPLQRSERTALVAAGTVGFAIALYSGVSDLGTLSHSQIPYAFPAVTARAAVAAALGLGLGLTAAVLIAFKRSEPDGPGRPGNWGPSPRSRVR